jgi:hypothetical protein
MLNGTRGPTVKDLQGMSDADVDVWYSTLRRDVIAIQGQIENWGLGITPEDWDDDWRDRAAAALTAVLDRLAWARAEAARRHGRNKYAKLRRRESRQQEDRRMNGAFVSASREVLDRETYLKVWDMARERYPEAFEVSLEGLCARSSP